MLPAQTPETQPPSSPTQRISTYSRLGLQFLTEELAQYERSCASPQEKPLPRLSAFMSMNAV